MLTMKRIKFTLGLAGIAAFSVAGAAQASSTSDRATGLVVYPKVVADEVGTCVGGASDGETCPTDGDCGADGYCRRVDTLIELGYRRVTSGSNISAHCFYINANSHCTNTGEVCTTSSDCADGPFLGTCRADWSELNFDVNLTPNQPLAWRALEGLRGNAELPDALAEGTLPCSGFAAPCSGNQGSNVPPVPESQFIGQLICIQIDPSTGDRRPTTCSAGSCPNDLLGEATIEEVGFTDDDEDLSIAAKSYNAIGLEALTNDGDGDLTIGPDESGEYAGCPGTLIVNHIFDGAVDPISDDYVAASELTLVPCTQDLFAQIVPAVTAQFLVYNEFEQRFSTSRQVNCLFDSPLSRIDTSQPERSIFNAGVAGTVAGQSRIRGVNGGLLGVAVLNFVDEPVITGDLRIRGGAAYNLNQSGERSEADQIRIP